jgi:hypothetical protein
MRESQMPLDSDRIELLAKRFLGIVRSNYQQGPEGRDRVLEALNALAIVVAFVMAGTGKDDAAQEFFNSALENQIDQILDQEQNG